MHYFVFTDEVGAYKSSASLKFRNSHPYYIRSNVLISMDDYREFQAEMLALNDAYRVPVGEEIKWSDLWSKTKGNSRTPSIRRMDTDRLKGYYRKVLEAATKKKSVVYLFTITNVHEQYCTLGEKHVYKFHLQEVFQRFQMDMKAQKGFAVFIMDELKNDSIKQIKEACHEFTSLGDFIKTYSNVYHGILTECSNQSAGIQLADYVAGVMNGYVKRAFLDPNNYSFAADMYCDYVAEKIRHNSEGAKMGFGIREVPSHSVFRQQLIEVFDAASGST